MNSRSLKSQAFLAGLSVAALLSPVMSAQAAEMLQCSHDGKADVTVSLGARQAFGAQLGCIEGPFVVGMTACAPKNGFGVSGGDGKLVGVTKDQKAVLRHSGPVARAMVDETKYLFTGGKVGFGSYKEAWKFEISRVSGAAMASVEGKPPVKYQCAKVQPKL